MCIVQLYFESKARYGGVKNINRKFLKATATKSCLMVGTQKTMKPWKNISVFYSIPMANF